MFPWKPYGVVKSYRQEEQKLQQKGCGLFKTQQGGVTFENHKDGAEFLLHYRVRVPYLDKDWPTAILKKALSSHVETKLQSRSDIWCDTVSRGLPLLTPTPPSGVTLCLEGFDRIERDEDSDMLSQFSRLTLSSGKTGGAGIRACSGGGNGSGVAGNRNEGGNEDSLKRSMDQISSDKGKGSSKDGDDPSDHRDKKPRDSKQGPTKTSYTPGTRRPFACPFFKKSATENIGCANWNSFKLLDVKDHCKEIHIMHLQCGRCRNFRAGSYDNIQKHLENENCKKSEFSNSSKGKPKDQDVQKAKSIDKAKNWQRVYEVLFPTDIPSPFWEDEAQDLAHHTNLVQRHAPISVEYRVGLAEFLGNHLSLEKGSVDNLLSEYDKRWSLKLQLLSKKIINGDSGVENTDSTKNIYNPLESSIIQQPCSAQDPIQTPDSSLENSYFETYVNYEAETPGMI